MFRCSVFVHMVAHLRSKLYPMAEKCVLLGCALNKNGTISMDVNLLKISYFFFGRNYLQGERQKNEDKF